MPSHDKNMGAIDPIVARQHVKTKSASIETAYGRNYPSGPSLQPFHQLSPSVLCSAINLHESRLEDEEQEQEEEEDFFHYKNKKATKFLASTSATNNSESLKSTQQANDSDPREQKRSSSSSNQPLSLSQDSVAAAPDRGKGASTSSTTPVSSPGYGVSRAKNFLSVAFGGFSSSGGGGGLRPAASASCLFSCPSTSNLSNSGGNVDQRSSDNKAKNEQAAGQQSSSTGCSGLASIPTRASLTHEWRKLRTPAKCRECSALVYFNGRECCACGFIVHKKCVVTLVIKCSGARSRQAARQHQQQKQPCAFKPHQQQQQQAKIKPMFGQPLASSDAEQVLEFVRRFIYEIDTRGLTARGIYRVSSIKSKVDRLCQYYDQNPSNLIDLSSFHPNIIANALKIYLRQLPEPLLTHKLYQRFIEIAKRSAGVSGGSSSASVCDSACCSSLLTSSVSPAAHSNRPSLLKKNNNNKNQATTKQELQLCRSSQAAPTVSSGGSSLGQQLEATSLGCGGGASSASGSYDQRLIDDIKQTIECLSPINREIVALLMRHLRRVADMSEENQMSAKNLSIIFGPTLLDLEKGNKSLAIVDNIHQARLVELMIQWAYEIFARPLELDDAASFIEPDHSSHVSC